MTVMEDSMSRSLNASNLPPPGMSTFLEKKKYNFILRLKEINFIIRLRLPSRLTSHWLRIQGNMKQDWNMLLILD